LGILKAGEHFTSGPHRALNLPEGASTLVGKRVQCPDVGERRQLVAAQAGALHDVFDRAEAAGRLQSNCPLMRADVAVIGSCADA
jgi:hypothetical protein